jgi:hypothetical protein
VIFFPEHGNLLADNIEYRKIILLTVISVLVCNLAPRILLSDLYEVIRGIFISCIEEVKCCKVCSLFHGKSEVAPGRCGNFSCCCVRQCSLIIKVREQVRFKTNSQVMSIYIYTIPTEQPPLVCEVSSNYCG